MHRLVDPPAREIIAKIRRQRRGQRHLFGLVKGAGEAFGLIRPHDFIAQRHQTGPQRAEHGVQFRPRRAGFVILVQRVPQVMIGALLQSGGLFAAQRHDLFKHRGEMGEIIAGAGLGPDPLGHGRDLGQFRRQTGRNFDRALIGATDVTQLRLRHRVQCARVNRGQPIPQTGIGFAGMKHVLQRFEFFAALLGGPTRHHGFLIPIQPAHDGTKRTGFTGKTHQIIKCGHDYRPSRTD